MLRDITIGQYYDVDSVVHKLDPRTKIIATVVYIVSLFCVKNILGFALAGIGLLTAVKLARIPLKFILRGLKTIMVLLLFTVVLNIFLVDGTPIVKWGFISISKEGIYNAVFMALRLVLLIIGSSLLTLTTKPISLTDGIERLLNPFRKIGLPAHELAMMMTIALRFIPTLMDETDKIMKAQQARGADFETGNLLRRAKSLIPLLVPLFISAFRIAQDLAMAMEARCYRGGDSRTRMHAMVLGKKDALAAFVLTLFLAAILLLRYWPF